MLPIQDIASAFHDGSIIAASPIVVGTLMEPARIVIRDLGQAYVVQVQCWPVSEHRRGRNLTAVKPFYVSGNYFPKEEAGGTEPRLGQLLLALLPARWARGSSCMPGQGSQLSNASEGGTRHRDSQADESVTNKGDSVVFEYPKGQWRKETQ